METKLPHFEKAEIEGKLVSLMDKAREDNSYLMELMELFVNNVASGDNSWVDNYGNEIDSIFLSWKEKWAIAAALSTTLKGFVLFFRSENQEAIDCLQYLLDEFTDLEKHRDIRGMAYMGLGSCYKSMGRIDQAMDMAMKGTNLISEGSEAKGWHVFTFRIIGEIHVYIGEFGQAEKFYNKARERMEALTNMASPTPLFRVYDGLGFCYMKMGRDKESEEWFQKALHVRGISEAEKSRVLCDLGILYRREPEKALTFLVESCEIRKRLKLDDAWSTSMINKAECLINLNEIDKAGNVLDEAEQVINKYNVTIKKMQFLNLKAYVSKGSFFGFMKFSVFRKSISVVAREHLIS